MARPTGLLFALLLGLGACSRQDAPSSSTSPPTSRSAKAQAASAASAMPAKSTGPALRAVDLAAIDDKARPGDDFFDYANGAWLKRAQIAPDRTYAGALLMVEDEVEGRVKALLTEAAAAPAGSPLQRIGDVYESFLDEQAIEKRGTTPIEGALATLAKIDGPGALATALGASLRADVDPLNLSNFHTANLFGLWVEEDVHDPGKNAAYLLQGGLGLPDRDYYLDASKEKAALIAQYQSHLTSLFKLAGISDPEKRAARVVALEKKIAQAHASRTDSEDVSKSSAWARADFAKNAPGLDWDAFFAAAHLDHAAAIVAWQPPSVTALAKLVKSEPLLAWKDLLAAHLLDDRSLFLPKAFADEHFAFYGKVMDGAEAPPPRWRTAIDVTSATLGEAVGKAYVAKWFLPESKKRIEEMVANLLAAYAKRIDALGWMAPSTKAKAKAKLGTLRVGVGYPDVWRDDSALVITRGDAFGNAARADAFELARAVAKIGQPVVHGEWAMTPQTVDAVNLPIRNEINFPAAILSPPFFDPEASAAANYGSIGATIGHEISHSFDNEGAKFDENGKLTNWWTADDLLHFQASAAALTAQYDAYRPLPDAHVNGKLTLSENIADLAGLAAAYDAWKASLGGAPAKEVSGLSGDRQFFLAYAQSWQVKMRDAMLRTMLLTNGHAPPRYRADTVRNLDAWYAAFGVKPGEALYLAPKDRVRVW